MELEEGERIEDLECKGLKIIQNKNYYTFTSDAVLLANFAHLRAREEAVEIGCGCGVISILLSGKNNFKKIYAFEIQKEMAALAKKNVNLNNLQEKIEIICDDIQNFERHLGKTKFDCVISNPPYMLSNVTNENKVKSLSRHDTLLPIEKLCENISKILKEGGRAYLIYSSSRTSELIFNLMQNSLEPKQIMFTQNGKGQVKRVLIEAVKNGKHGVKVLPELVTNDKDGGYIELLHTRNFK